VCGNLVVEAGETCDPPGSDPPPSGGNLCRADCTYCGDGFPNGGEDCDDGNTNDLDACPNDCTIP
jgi:cysteine-rich repeat protein